MLRYVVVRTLVESESIKFLYELVRSQKMEPCVGSIFFVSGITCKMVGRRDYRLISYALSLLYKVFLSILSNSAALVLLKPVFSSVEMMACRSALPETDLRRL